MTGYIQRGHGKIGRAREQTSRGHWSRTCIVDHHDAGRVCEESNLPGYGFFTFFITPRILFCFWASSASPSPFESGFSLQSSSFGSSMLISSTLASQLSSRQLGRLPAVSTSAALHHRRLRNTWALRRLLLPDEVLHDYC